MSGKNSEIVLVTLVFALMGSGQSASKISFFNSDEHDFIGESISLPDLEINANLTLPNEIQLTFGQIVALAGDFYGIPDKPIIVPRKLRWPPKKLKKPRTPRRIEQHRRRFLKAYGSLATKNRAKIDEQELNTLLQMIKEDQAVIATDQGELHTNSEWDAATGGTWKKPEEAIDRTKWGRMMKLAAGNTDHFQPEAEEAYLVGHQLAMEKARQAARETSPNNKKRKLMAAYSIDAFACHYLTDCFSSGHIRTPRVELKKEGHYRLLHFFGYGNVGDFFSAVMHDEDCKFGLRVRNKKNNTWIAYGDKYLHNDENQINREYVLQAVNQSVKQIHEAYQNPEKKINTDAVTDFIPFVDPDAVNNAPLWQIKDGELARRKDVNNLQDTNTVTYNSWKVWKVKDTAEMLKSYNPTNTTLPFVEKPKYSL